MDTINSRIKSLRSLMKSHNIDAYIIPSSDAHQSEYVGAYAGVREWISGFNGSAGTIIVTADHAGLWTDSRYFIQAEDQLKSSEIILHKIKRQGYPEFILWLKEHLHENSTVGCDGFVFSKGQIDRYKKLLGQEISLDVEADLTDAMWEDRPSLPQSKIYEHDVLYAGKSRKDKLEGLRQKFTPKADSYLVTALDDIAWLLNLRASDVNYNPVFISYVIVRKADVLLFVDEEKLDADLIQKLKEDGIQIQAYNRIVEYAKNMESTDSIFISPTDISMGLYNAISGKIIKGDNFIRNAKGIKNETEINHVRNAMEKDGVALLRTFRWLEGELQSRTVKETEVRDQLAHFRSKQEHYVGESFGAIVGYKGNGAIIHYSPEEESCAEIGNDGMLLVDSGAQYLDGTTDTTRTIHTGTPTQDEKESYTLVLKGYIALDQAVYPRGTNGLQIDAFARMPLWKHYKNYGHGTGHGVGFLLNVHEGPQGFSPIYGSRTKTVLEPGMITSNEPGFYKDGEYGIRIENLILTKEASKTAYGDFLCHEALTLYPIATNLIDKSLLNDEEITWLNDYHEQVYDRLSPRITDEEKVWLKEKCGELM